MKKNFSAIIVISVITLFSVIFLRISATDDITGAPPFGAARDEVPDNPFEIYRNWIRPDVPPKVGIQVGHWKNEELPDELHKLKGNTGAQGGGKWEWEVNYEITTLIAEKLQNQGIEVDILPSTVPEDYWADVFIAIHADGSTNMSKSGYKFAAPWRDFTDNADELVSLLEQSYESYTDLEKDPNVTKNMRGYYAFSWWRYDHAIHPMTTAAIAETGFLTNYSDRDMLINNPDLPATAIAEAITQFISNRGLIEL